MQNSLLEYDELEGIAWTLQCLDGAMIKAPLALELVGRNPTDRGKKRQQKSLLTDEKGVPLALVISAANTHDVKLLADTLNAVQIERPYPERVEQNLSLDAGYVGTEAHQQVVTQGYVPHVRLRSEEIAAKLQNPEYQPRRWVAEVCHSWFNRFRKLLVRYEKKARSFLGLLMIAASIIVSRKIKRENKGDIIYG